MEIFTNFSHVVGKFLVTRNCIVMVICLFRKGVTNVITMLWMIIKSRFNVEFFTLFCNGFTTFSASKISRMKRPSWWKVPCQSPLEQWQKQRLIKVPNVEVSGLFKDYDFHLVQSLDTSLIEMNAFSLNYWLSKFVQEVAKSSSVRGFFLL